MPNPEPQRNRNPRSSQPSAPVSGASRRRDAWLLSVDDGLLLELGPLLGDRYRTRPIDGIDALAEAGSSPWMVIFDASLRHDARAISARIEQQYPMAPIIIVCADGQSSSWASALHRGSVCAILERGALGTRAWQDALQIAEQRLDSTAAAATSTTLASLSSTGNPFPPKRRLMLLLPLLLAGGLGWYFFSRAGNDHAAKGSGQRSHGCNAGRWQRYWRGRCSQRSQRQPSQPGSRRHCGSCGTQAQPTGTAVRRPRRLPR